MCRTSIPIGNGRSRCPTGIASTGRNGIRSTQLAIHHALVFHNNWCDGSPLLNYTNTQPYIILHPAASIETVQTRLMHSQ